MRNLDLKNKVAIVTASTSGIGLAIALTLAENNAKVYMAARNKQKADQIINNHKDLDLNFVYFDANDKQSFSSFIKEVYKKEKRIDILVNNFGLTNAEDGVILNTNHTNFEEIVMRNIDSTYIASQEAINIMMKQHSGSIINISSIASRMSDIARIAYSTSKALINSLTQNIALQVGMFGIRCNAILPGLIETDFSKKLPQTMIDLFVSSIPLSRIGYPQDIADTALFLSSDLSSYITGQLIAVSGGLDGGNTPLYGPLYAKKK